MLPVWHSGLNRRITADTLELLAQSGSAPVRWQLSSDLQNPLVTTQLSLHPIESRGKSLPVYFVVKCVHRVWQSSGIGSGCNGCKH